MRAIDILVPFTTGGWSPHQALGIKVLLTTLDCVLGTHRDDAAHCQAFDLIRGLIEILVPFSWSEESVHRIVYL
jgi:hypothetical protein